MESNSANLHKRRETINKWQENVFSIQNQFHPENRAAEPCNLCGGRKGELHELNHREENDTIFLICAWLAGFVLVVEEACKLKTKKKAKTLIKMRECRFRVNTKVLTENTKKWRPLLQFEESPLQDTKTSKRLRKLKTQKGNWNIVTHNYYMEKYLHLSQENRACKRKFWR
jgi:hypothetical protein